MTARTRAQASAQRKTLTAKERMFVAEYLKDMNGAAAARRAGYAEKHSKQTAHDLLQREPVRRAVLEAIEQQKERTLVTADETLLSIQRNALKAEAVQEFASAIRGFELIGKRYKLFTDKVEVVNTVPRAERLRAARQRRQQGDA